MQTSSAKLPAFCSRFQTEVRTLSVNETKITSQDTSTGKYFETEGYQESTSNEKLCF